MITPPAPAFSAFSALTAKSQVPRWTSAMSPGVKPAKSAASQPLLELLGVAPGGITTSTGWIGAVTSPLPEYSAV
jgi:hypothetical protein